MYLMSSMRRFLPEKFSETVRGFTTNGRVKDSLNTTRSQKVLLFFIFFLEEVFRWKESYSHDKDVNNISIRRHYRFPEVYLQSYSAFNVITVIWLYLTFKNRHSTKHIFMFMRRNIVLNFSLLCFLRFLSVWKVQPLAVRNKTPVPPPRPLHCTGCWAAWIPVPLGWIPIGIRAIQSRR